MSPLRVLDCVLLGSASLVVGERFPLIGFGGLVTDLEGERLREPIGWMGAGSREVMQYFLFPQSIAYEAGAEFYVSGNGSGNIYWFEKKLILQLKCQAFFAFCFTSSKRSFNPA